MFKKVGREIKFWAELRIIVNSALAIVINVFLMLALIRQGYTAIGIILFILLSVIACVLIRIGSIILYGFGELIDCVQQITTMIDTDEEMYY